MVLSAFDHNDLVLTLFEGMFAPNPWDTFLHRLLARTGAGRIVLEVRGSAAAQVRRVAARGAAGGTLEAERAALDAVRHSGLRASRVYALEELLDFDDPGRRAAQDGKLTSARIGDARLIRVAVPDGVSVSLALLHERAAFGAAESALLTALVPAIGIAAGNLGTAALLRVRLAAADDALARAGISQAVVDRQGHVLAADARWHSATAGAALLTAASSAAGAGGTQMVRAPDGGGQTVLVRPLPAPEINDGSKQQQTGDEPGLAIGAVRRGMPLDAATAAPVIAAELGLTPREAALAAQLAAGRSLVEAGRGLHLTEETARNYSKRIYAKTGTSGQADLVRVILSGLAILT